MSERKGLKMKTMLAAVFASAALALTACGDHDHDHNEGDNHSHNNSTAGAHAHDDGDDHDHARDPMHMHEIGKLTLNGLELKVTQSSHPVAGKSIEFKIDGRPEGSVVRGWLEDESGKKLTPSAKEHAHGADDVWIEAKLPATFPAQIHFALEFEKDGNAEIGKLPVRMNH